MPEGQRFRPAAVAGPNGEALTLGNIPSGATHWTARRKAQIVAAVDGGLLSIDEACARYRMNPEEFLLWRRRLYHDGKASLRITQTQKYREG